MLTSIPDLKRKGRQTSPSYWVSSGFTQAPVQSPSQPAKQGQSSNKRTYNQPKERNGVSICSNAAALIAFGGLAVAQASHEGHGAKMSGKEKAATKSYRDANNKMHTGPLGQPPRPD